MREILAQMVRGECSAEDGLRAMLRYPFWKVTLFDEGPETVPLDDGEQVLVAESQPEIEDLSQEVYSAGELLRRLDPQLGIAFDPDEPWGTVIRRNRIEELRSWLKIIELEDALAHPGPGQHRVLLEGPWWVAVDSSSEVPAVQRVDGFQVISLFTAPDLVASFRRVEKFRGLEVAKFGKELWDDLARRDDFDALRVNPYRPCKTLLGPHIAAALRTGVDPRPGAQALPVSSLQEVHTWLDFSGARKEESKRLLETSVFEGRTLIQVRAWWNYQAQDLSFQLVEKSDASEEPSRILCAAQLVRSARGLLAGLPLKRAGRPEAHHARRAAQAKEHLLEAMKFLENDSLPFSSLRSPEGAAAWRREPEFYTRKSLETMLQQAQICLP